MRVLTTSVLILEGIVVGLAIPVALVVGGRSAGAAWLLGGLALACLLLPALAGRRGFVPAGWALQGLVIASGLLVPMMFGLGALFATLWWTALRLGRVAGQAGQAGQARRPARREGPTAPAVPTGEALDRRGSRPARLSTGGAGQPVGWPHRADGPASTRRRSGGWTGAEDG